MGLRNYGFLLCKSGLLHKCISHNIRDSSVIQAFRKSRRNRTTKPILIITFIFVSTILGSRGLADVIESDASGFQVSMHIEIKAAPSAVYEKFKQVGSWWHSDHTFSGIAENLVLKDQPGGCFCEYFDASQGVVHLRVIYVRHGDTIRFSGALGPLQAHGAKGTLTIRFVQSEMGTSLKLDYVVIGRKLSGWAEAVDRVLLEQLIRLRRLVEFGDPELQE